MRLNVKLALGPENTVPGEPFFFKRLFQRRRRNFMLEEKDSKRKDEMRYKKRTRNVEPQAWQKERADREHLWQALGRCYFWQNPRSIFQVPAKTGLEDQGQGLALHRRCARRPALYPRSVLAVESEPHAPSVWGVTCGPGRLSRHQHVSCLLWVQQACCADGIYCGTCPAPGRAQAPPRAVPAGVLRGVEEARDSKLELFLGAKRQASVWELLLLEARRPGLPPPAAGRVGCSAQRSGQQGAWGHDFWFPLSFMS